MRVLFLTASATAFMAPTPVKTTGPLKAKSLVPWVDAPEGLEAWPGGQDAFDPLFLSTMVPIEWLREAELKHGRVAMLATLGWITADFVKLPGEVHQVSSLEAHDVAVTSGAMTQILIFIGIIETCSFVAIKEMIVDESGRKFLPFFFTSSSQANPETMPSIR